MFRTLVLCVVALLLHDTHAISRALLYPHGRGVPDKSLPPQDDVSSPEIFLKTPIVFFDETYQSIYINSNGLMSFVTDIPTFFNFKFPLDYPVISPLYTNVDIRASGAVYYRESQEEQVLDRATRTVRQAFTSARDFQAESALVATWEDVGYHKQGVDKVNTFQAVVISNGQDSFVEFLYPENGIQWTTGTGQRSGLPDALAQAGFISGDGRIVTLKGSGTDQVIHLKEWSNVGNPGQWLFHVGRLGPDGLASPPDHLHPQDTEPPRSCTAGVFSCHSRASCVDNEYGFCCICQPGFYGNGINCLSEELPVRVVGKVSGTINGVQLADLDLQAYVMPKDGRTYTAITRVPQTVGFDMQSLNILGTTIGWLFARPVKGASNGYQMTGGSFNHTVTVNYPQTGHQMTLRQRYTGLDVFQQLTMSAELKGDVPSIPMGRKINIKDYDEQYSWLGPGHLIAHSSQVFQLEGVEIDNTYTVEQVFQYEECTQSSRSSGPLRLKVARNYVGYENETIIRYAMTNKVIPIGVDEDPCTEGRSQCGRHSTCVTEGDSFRCACNPGYQLLVTEGGESCMDTNECNSGVHNCHYDATCYNNPGSFYCQCNPGFTGDGYQCERDRTCQDIRCDYNAHCIQRSRNAPQCVCKTGFYGNGTVCWPDVRPPEQEPPPTDYEHGGQDSREHDEEDGGEGGRVVVPRCILTVCFCPDGYFIDETVTKCLKLDEAPQESEPKPLPGCFEPGKCACPKGYKYNNHTDECDLLPEVSGLKTKGPSGFQVPCNVLNRCHPQAQCVPDASSGNYHCECNVGFQGNGVQCTPIDSYFQFEEDECVSPIDCIGEAECVLDERSQKYTCVCMQGFTKDPVTRTCVLDDVEEPASSSCLELQDCHPYATCVINPDTEEATCRCNPGYEGDGRHECRKTQIGCNVLNNCAAGTAECRYDVTAAGHRCKCKQGYQGDGLTCTPLLTCLDNPSLCGEFSSCRPSQLGGYSCQCDPGFIGNGQLCKPFSEKPGNFLLLNQGIALFKVPYRTTSGDAGKPIRIHYQQAIGLDIDCAEGRVYWSDIAGKKIQSGTYSAADVVDFATTDIGSIEGLAVDWLSRNIYWTDSTRDTVEVASLDNSELRKTIAQTGLVNPRGIAVHPSRGKIFWSDWNRDAPKIEWANMDGSERGVFLQGPSVQLPNSLAIDYSTDELCWADAGTKAIECIGIGSKYERSVAKNCSYPFGLAISQDHYYWTDWKTAKIERATRPGMARLPHLNVSFVGSGKLYGIVAVPDTCPRMSSICQHDYGKCPDGHLCLPDGTGSRICACGHASCTNS